MIKQLPLPANIHSPFWRIIRAADTYIVMETMPNETVACTFHDIPTGYTDKFTLPDEKTACRLLACWDDAPNLGDTAYAWMARLFADKGKELFLP